MAHFCLGIVCWGSCRVLDVRLACVHEQLLLSYRNMYHLKTNADCIVIIIVTIYPCRCVESEKSYSFAPHLHYLLSLANLYFM